RAALRQAVRWRLIARAPTDDVTLPVGKAKVKAIWTPAEARQFLASGDRTLFRFLLDSLCRLGEALALTWADVDLEAGVVQINATRTVAADGSITTRSGTKAGESRRIELMPETVAALRRHRTGQLQQRLKCGPLWEEQGVVFERGDGHHYHPDTVRKELRRACRAAGVPELTPHGLRHCGATMAVAQGVPLHAVMQRLGHANIGLTANLYAHHSPEADHEVAEALRRVLEG
ncbi:MAG TPA: site-specific integrase, partial [Armatimonadota bacterium]|nr:site-specific integrase [Armatimonadota bacterium]